jgi:hypothetical protein
MVKRLSSTEFYCVRTLFCAFISTLAAFLRYSANILELKSTSSQQDSHHVTKCMLLDTTTILLYTKYKFTLTCFTNTTIYITQQVRVGASLHATIQYGTALLSTVQCVERFCTIPYFVRVPKWIIALNCTRKVDLIR